MIVIFNPLTGEIARTVECPQASYLSQVNEGEGYVFSDVEQALFVIEAHYVVDDVIVPRPTLSFILSINTITANGTDTCLISGIPAGAEITSNDTTITTDGSDIEFVTDIPGEHRLQITLWPYQDAEVVINAI